MSSKRYCVLWIPTCLHSEISPVQASSDLSVNDTKPIQWEYTYNAIGEIDLDGNIRLKDVLASDLAEIQVFVNFTLLKEGVTIVNGVEKNLPIEKQSNCFIPCRNIYIEAKLEDGTIFDTLLLRCLNARRNGLFLYEYEVHPKYLTSDPRLAINKYLLNSELNITNFLYHSIKSFYHIHEFHSVYKDSILRPFSSVRPVNIDCANNPALLHYLNEFETIFIDENSLLKDFKSFIDQRLAWILNRKDNIDPAAQSRLFHKLSVQHYAIIEDGFITLQKQCSRALNMHIYFQTLFYSKHNKLFDIRSREIPIPDTQVSMGETCSVKSLLNRIFTYFEKPKPTVSSPLCYGNQYHTITNDFYKKAININSAIESVKLLHHEVSHSISNEFLKIISAQATQLEKITQQTSTSSRWLTVGTCLIGIIVGLGTSLAINYSTYSPENDLKQVKQTMTLIDSRLTDDRQNLLNNINDQHSVNVNQMEEIKSMLQHINSKLSQLEQQTKLP